MRLNGQKNRGRSLKASRLLGVALLFLFAHAFAASATHFHRLQRAENARPGLSSDAGFDRQTRSNAETANAHAECLLCRLQRSLVAGLQHGNPATPAPSQKIFAGFASGASTNLDGSHLLPAGRAPPPA